MPSTLVKYTSLLGIIFLLVACNNDKVEELTTELRVNVKVEGKDASGAKVYLYRSITDMETRTAPTDSAVTNGSGVAVFKNLKSVLYYIHAFYADENTYWDNSKSQYRLDDDLVDGAVTVANIELKNKRSALPSRMVIKGLDIVSYDTLNYSPSQNVTCSDKLVFEIWAATPDYDEKIVTQYDVRDAATFCITGNKPTLTAFKFKNEASFGINEYATLFAFALRIDTAGVPRYFPGTYYSTYLNLDISNFDITPYWKQENVKGKPLPNKVRVMEGIVTSPRYISTKVDLLIDWQ